MDRAIPEYNRIMCERELNRNKQIHKRKVRQMEPRIDNSLPSTIGYLSNNTKRDHMIERKYYYIYNCF